MKKVDPSQGSYEPHKGSIEILYLFIRILRFLLLDRFRRHQIRFERRH
jgi:hypothetical protein